MRKSISKIIIIIDDDNGENLREPNYRLRTLEFLALIGGIVKNFEISSNFHKEIPM